MFKDLVYNKAHCKLEGERLIFIEGVLWHLDSLLKEKLKMHPFLILQDKLKIDTMFKCKKSNICTEALIQLTHTSW